MQKDISNAVRLVASSPDSVDRSLANAQKSIQSIFQKEVQVDPNPTVLIANIIERNRHIFNFKLTVNDCTRLAHSRVLSSLDR